MRTREYVLPQKAQMFQCNRQLISKEMCVAAVPECPEGLVYNPFLSFLIDGVLYRQTDESVEEEVPLESLDPAVGGVCSTSPWGAWSTCSETCGVGFKMRNRFFVDNMGMKKCPHITTG